MYQDLIDKLRAEFPKHHLELLIYPAGGSIDANACDECGSDKSGSQSWNIKRGGTIDDAIARLKAELSE